MPTIKFVGGQSAGSGQYRSSEDDDIQFFNSSTGGSATIVNDFLGRTDFYDNSTAGYSSIQNSYGPTTFHDNSNAGRAKIQSIYAATVFRDNSNAALATFTFGGDGASVFFADKSSAGRATFQAVGSYIDFTGRSTAANSTISLSGPAGFFGSAAYFDDDSTAGSANITVDPGSYLIFEDFSTAGSARIVNNAEPGDGYKGTVDFSATSGPQNTHRLSAGSLAGAGSFYLGSNRLAVGSLNLSTTVSGSIRDGSFRDDGGIGGSLEKVGSGTLTLSGANTYTGGTILGSGRLELASVQAAGTGAITFTSGAQILQLDAGTLGAPGGTFGNVLAGFDYGDTLDLRGLAYRAGATAVLSGETLTVASGGATESFTLAGNYTGRRFQVFGDGAAGSAIRVLPGTDPAQTATRRGEDVGYQIVGAETVGQGADAPSAMSLYDGRLDTVPPGRGGEDLITGLRPNEDGLGHLLSQSTFAASLIEGSGDPTGTYARLTHARDAAALFLDPAGAADPGGRLAMLHDTGTSLPPQNAFAGHDLRL